MGMMTIALLEAALAGKPSISVELGLLESGAEDPCVGNTAGYTHPIYHRAALREAARHLCQGRYENLYPTPRTPLHTAGASSRVADAILG
jgi:hypothetical protein